MFENEVVHFRIIHMLNKKIINILNSKVKISHIISNFELNDLMKSIGKEGNIYEINIQIKNNGKINSTKIEKYSN